jgi:hypothetical protein
LGFDLIFLLLFAHLQTPLLMQATYSLLTDALQILHSSIARIEGAYAPATMRA